jgi:hypothetical protein
MMFSLETGYRLEWPSGIDAGFSPTRACLLLHFAAGSPMEMDCLPRTALLDGHELDSAP